MSAPFKVRVHGRSGHASMPGIADNALVKSARYLEALGAYEPPRELIPEARGFLEATPRRGSAARRGARTGPRSPPDAPRARRAPSRVHALADDDRRLAPAERRPGAVRDHGRLPAAARDDAGGRRAADPGGARGRRVRARVPRGRSAERARKLDTPLWDALARFTAEIEPGARLAPMACPGFTDSHYLRTAFGTAAYGFFPLRTMDPELATKLVHSANERIAVDDLELGVDMLRSVAQRAPRVMSEVADALVVFGITGDLARTKYAPGALRPRAARAAHVSGHRSRSQSVLRRGARPPRDGGDRGGEEGEPRREGARDLLRA